jgi:diguanylate cyclase (GGDEF)-like protein
MNRTRGVSYALLTAATVAYGLLLLRVAFSSVPSVTYEFIWNRLTYVYVFAATALVFLTVGYILGRKVDTFRRLSTIDPLTDLSNRRALESRLVDEWRRSKRYGSPLSILLIDIDGLKRINDERGHAAGDRVLREAAEAISASLRGVDCGARWGGDEFAVVAPNTAIEAAHALAQRLLEQMTQRIGADHGVPASIGVATFDPAKNASVTTDSMMREADIALYRAKSRGRYSVREAQ